MVWFLSVFVIAGLLLLTVPSRLTSSSENLNMPGLSSLDLHKSWLLLPLTILCWLGGHLFTNAFSFFSLAAVGFVLTPLTLLIPAWRPWVLACALLSMISVLLGTLLG
ncbi:hypothetical protein [Shewanella fodinae]|uniref:Uncharacterized protein n=1 Tax=Shewanella fodinae TaxID=552357 RepID=A0A4R2F6W7_9GAMM|nr:hypothetical protein [Shewanella fodinae]MCL2905800.1 hypothetical protein [Shewanella fodinae]TCN82554.1 hypothetical protein EDC91_11822 [Shewanella fodinae]GGY96876.1 hypothetical protein GCM10007169_12250 [Shewanella fodinae]